MPESMSSIRCLFLGLLSNDSSAVLRVVIVTDVMKTCKRRRPGLSLKLSLKICLKLKPETRNGSANIAVVLRLVEVEVNLRPTDSQSASLFWCQAPVTNFSFSSKFPSDNCMFVIL
jgi:hypothetical protein